MTEKGILQYAVGAIAVLMLVLVASMGFYTVDQGERGVILRNGAVIGTAEPGLGFKVPFIDSVKMVNVQANAKTYDNVAAYSKDQQTAIMNVSVNYTFPVDSVVEIYSEYGGGDGVVSRVLDLQVSKALEEVFGRFNAVTAIQDRVRLGAEFQTAIQNAVNGPITVTSVQIGNIDFSDAYEKSIEDRMKAEVEVKTAEQKALTAQVDAERDAKVKITAANAEATAKIAAAEADAKAVTLRGEAEAAAIRAKSAALSSNPALIDLTKAERWNGVLPTTVLPNDVVPFIDAQR